MIAVNEVEVKWHEGMTVSDALAAMNYDFAHITVTVNDHFVPTSEYNTHIIPDNADVRAIHLFHGG